MSYKKEINEIRKRIEWQKYNLDQITEELSLYPDELEELLLEHEYYTKLIEYNEAKIEALQPWYRKLFGVPY